MGNLEGVWKCLECVWICLEVVCNVLKGVLKVSEGFPNILPFDVVRCPHLNCSPINKVCGVSLLSIYFFLPTPIVPFIKKICAVSPPQYMFLLCGVPPPSM